MSCQVSGVLIQIQDFYPYSCSCSSWIFYVNLWFPLHLLSRAAQKSLSKAAHPRLSRAALCHQCLTIGAADQVSQISGTGLEVMCRLRPVNGMHLAMKKGSPRCAVKLSCREFIKTVPNFLQKNFFKVATSIKNHNFGSFACS